MKKFLSILAVTLLIITFVSCGHDITYRTRVISNKKVVLIEQTKIKGLQEGDTVQLSYSDAYNSWSIKADEPGLRDTSYLFDYYKTDTTRGYILVDEKIAVIEKIIK